MKKVLCIFLLAILCLTCFVACDGDESNNNKPSNNTKATQLSAPVVVKKDGQATWEKIENATKYEISINGESVAFVEANVTSYPLYDNQVLRVRAVGDDVNYTTSEWSNGVFISIELPEDEL